MPLLDNLFQIADIDHVKQVVEETKDKEEAIKEGISYFNNERFWECHEVLKEFGKIVLVKKKFLYKELFWLLQLWYIIKKMKMKFVFLF